MFASFHDDSIKLFFIFISFMFIVMIWHGGNGIRHVGEVLLLYMWPCTGMDDHLLVSKQHLGV